MNPLKLDDETKARILREQSDSTLSIFFDVLTVSMQIDLTGDFELIKVSENSAFVLSDGAGTLQ